MPLRCKVFARLNNCANCDEADVSFVQTQKTQSLYYVHMNVNGNYIVIHEELLLFMSENKRYAVLGSISRLYGF